MVQAMEERIASTNTADSLPTEIAEGLPPALARADDALSRPIPNIRVAEPTFMEVFFAWEMLRLLYNGLLIFVVLGMALKSGFSPLVVIFFVEPALFANLCFCAGPVAEGYLRWLGFPRQACRWVIFGLGVVIAIGLAITETENLLRKLDK